MSDEALPRWDCEHDWIPDGSPVVFWNSNETLSKPPPGAPAFQKVKCLKCWGVSWMPIAPGTPP